MASRRSRKDPNAYVKALIKGNPNLLVPHYLMACYAYYVEDQPIISDALFDEMSKELLAKWDSIEHYHKHLITKEDLEAGTGFAIQYNERIKGATRRLRINVDPHLKQALSDIAERAIVDADLVEDIYTYGR